MLRNFLISTKQQQYFKSSLFQFTTQKRYFIVQTNSETNLATQSLFDQGHMIFAAKKENGMFYIFNTKDEVIPFDFINSDKSIKDYTIEEIELRTETESKQLSHLYKFR